MSPTWVRTSGRLWHLAEHGHPIADVGRQTLTRCGQSVAVQAVASPALLPNMMGKVCEDCRRESGQ